MRELVFLGDSLGDCGIFRRQPERKPAFSCTRFSKGFEPSDWKPRASVGQGVREIRIPDEAGAFRVIYIAKIEDAVFVLHAFQKKTQ